MSIKYKRTELGMTKPVEIVQSNDNMVLVYTFELQLAKMADMENAEPFEIIQAQLDSIKLSKEFLTGLLKLTDKQQDKLGGLEVEATVEIANDLGMRLMGMDPDKDVSAEDEESEKN